MASLTEKLKQLIGHKEYSELLDEAFDLLVTSGSPLTNFNVGGVTRTVLELVSHLVGEFHDLLLDILPQGYVQSATGDYLDLRVADQGLARLQPQTTKGDVRFSRLAIGGAVVIPASTIVATPLGSDGDRHRYFTVADAVLPDGELYVDVEVEAEAPGSAYNVAAGQIESLLTPIAGIDQVENQDDWISQEGSDQEADDVLRNRALLRWAELSRGATADAYKAWALAVNGVAGVAVMDDFPRGPGTVDVVITSTAGMPSAELIALVETYIGARRPVCSDVLVKAPTEVAQAFLCTVKVEPGTDLAVIEADAEAVLQAFFVQSSTLDIAPLGPGDDFVLNQATAALLDLLGVVDVEWTAPVGNVLAANDELISPSAITVTAEEWE